MKNNTQTGDCEKTIQFFERVLQDQQLKQEFLNQIYFSLFIVDGNNYSYKLLKEQAKELILMIEDE